MDFCKKRNIIYAIVLGLCLASLVQTKMILGALPLVEVVLQFLCAMGISWLMRGDWFTKLWGSLLTLLIAVLISMGSQDLLSVLRTMNYLIPFTLGFLLSTTVSFLKHRENS